MNDRSNDTNKVLLEGIVDHMLEGIIAIDAVGTILMVNRSIRRLTGYDEAELIGKNVTTLMSSNMAPHHQGYIEEFLKSGEHDVTSMRRYLPVHGKNGRKFNAEISITKMLLNNQPIFIGSIIDVTEKLFQQEKIYELSRITEENTSPVMKITSDGVITYANPGSEQILAHWNIKIQQTVSDEIRGLIRQALDTNENGEVVVKCQEKTFYRLLITPIKEHDYVNVYGSDISELVKREKELLTHRTALEHLVKERTKEAQEALMNAERANRAKSLFLANMSHEIRTPLSSIIGYSEFLMEPDQTAEDRQKSIETIIRSSHHLKNLINGVLDLTKIEAEKLELEISNMNLVNTVEDVLSVVEPMAKEKCIELSCSYKYPLPANVETDAMRFRQILLNLCSNAIKFTNKGRVDLIVSYLSQERKLEFLVKDTGIGMTAEQLKLLFEPFQQADVSTSRKYGGSGLGLCLSKRLIKLMGGNIDVESEPGLGSNFRFYISLASQANVNLINERIDSGKQESKASVIRNDKINGNVLLVEDTPEIQVLVATILRKMGLEVETANNGEEAVAMSKDRSYSLVLMDIQMPVMDGFTAVQMMRAYGYDKPIVALTANAMREDEENCLACGCDGFLAKPVQREQLYKVLRTYINGEDAMSDDKLVSTLFETDPDMVDMVKTFLDKLPDYIDQCRLALESENWEALTEVLHILKGMGGSYGYPTVTETAGKAEAQLKAGDSSNARAFVEQLLRINDAAQRGYQEQAS